MATTPSDVEQEVSALIKLLITEITEGCGNEACVSPVCYTYRIRTADRPVRRWTMTSARAIAFHLASLPRSRTLLCHDTEGRMLLGANRGSTSVVPSEKAGDTSMIDDDRALDTKSMSQHIFNTKAVQTFLAGSQTSLEESDLELLKDFDRSIAFVRTRLSNRPEEGRNSSTASVLDSALNRFFAFFKKTNAGHTPGYFLISFPGSAAEVMFKMTQKLAPLIAEFGDHRLVYEICSGLVQAQKIFLMELLLRIFLRHWSCNMIIEVKSLAGYALRALNNLEHHHGPLYKDLQHIHNLVSARLDLIQIAKSIKEKPIDDALSLLEFKWLFNTTEQARIFRLRCLLRMGEVVDQQELPRLLVSLDRNDQRGNGARPPMQNYDFLFNELINRTLANASSRTFLLKASRETALEDSFDLLWRREERELLRPLCIVLDGVFDYGQDLGGIAQEFLQLCWRQALRPEAGLFEVEDDTRATWFSQFSPAPLFKYEILGLLMALSVYNGFTLPVSFPPWLYSFLLARDYSLELDDIQQYWPSLASGLAKLRDFTETPDRTVEDLSLTYDYTIPALGETFHFDMQNELYDWEKEDVVKRTIMDHWESRDGLSDIKERVQHGADVTAKNRSAYIQDFLAWRFWYVVRWRLKAFTRGFWSVLPLHEMTFLEPETLSVLVQGMHGGHKLSMMRLMRYTAYSGAYQERHENRLPRALQHFWNVVQAWDANQEDDEVVLQQKAERKVQFLKFVTASERLPVAGEAGLSFNIAPADIVIDENLSEEEQMRLAPLPTSSTCFSQLKLPQYASEAVLKAKLEKALDLGSAGFGLA